ncbi:hypothetical protein [Cyanobium sp. Morenito 9A2]|uniref:hypothetical protein n=1 Tax=Cyanobium sp. Morenito 9A2 TaxID=2823718 RepID=UPI0020CEE5DA|nr:hypothetical protein [Cyanobium sp. Morenito 9A2]MCP9848447.1 hypothetical protein [Cyanobium sp. Morenito 9A2]
MKPWTLALGGGLALALVQQQLLLSRAPRLLGLSPAAASSGPGALELRFSRPMDRDSLARSSRITPTAAHQWLGEGNRPRLLLASGVRVFQPIDLSVAGADRRGMALAPQAWRWDPRPRIVAVASVAGGEQAQLQDHDGRWRPLSPVWSSIPALEPLGDGSGVALVSADARGQHRVWRVDVKQRNLAARARGLARPVIGAPRPLGTDPLLFAYLSSNRQGDLVVQGSTEASGLSSTDLHPRGGGSHRLPLPSSGPVQLVPQGGALVVPEVDGLSLMRMGGPVSGRQILPGSRDLSSFCPVGGRALLVHHRPDFTRALEIVEPGQAPRTLWAGPQALVASACERNGSRIWALTIEGLGQPRLTLLALDRNGRRLGQRELRGWELEPGTGLELDPSRLQLLLTLRPQQAGGRPSQARPALIDATSLELRLLNHPVRQARWLVAG